MTAASVRAALKTTLTNAGVAASVYDHVPEAPIAPAIMLIPDSPYFESCAIGNESLRSKMNLVVSPAVAYVDNAAALDNLEQLIFDVLAALPSGFVVGDVNRPTIVEIGVAKLLVADIHVSVYIEITF